MKFLKIQDPFAYRDAFVFDSLEFQKSGWLPHYAVTSSNASSIAFSCDIPCSSYLLMAVSIRW